MYNFFVTTLAMKLYKHDEHTHVVYTVFTLKYQYVVRHS